MNRIKCVLFLFFLCLFFALNSESADKSPTELPLPGFDVEQTRSDPDRPALSHEREYEGPIIDTHTHLYPPRERDATRMDIDKRELKKIIKILRMGGVESIIFMPTPNDGIRRNQELGVIKREMIREMAGDRVKNFCGSNYITNWLDASYHNGYTEEEVQEVLKQLAKDMESGKYAGVGELAITHFDKGYGGQHVLEFPPNFEPFLRIVDLIAKRRMWLDLHIEPVDPKGRSYEKETFGGIELLFRRNPDLKLIYSHTAMTNPTNARRILKKYPNVMMNIKIVKKHQNWKNLEPVVNTSGELYEDWAQLFEEMPGRFMVGTDFHFGRKGVRLKKYEKKIKWMRRLLGTLNPKFAEMIAYQNAKNLVGDNK